MSTIHWVFGTLHNWVFAGFCLVLLTLGMTVAVLRHRKSISPGLKRGPLADRAQEVQETPRDPDL